MENCFVKLHYLIEDHKHKYGDNCMKSNSLLQKEAKPLILYLMIEKIKNNYEMIDIFKLYDIRICTIADALYCHCVISECFFQIYDACSEDYTVHFKLHPIILLALNVQNTQSPLIKFPKDIWRLIYNSI